jgi:hypothetical protein
MLARTGLQHVISTGWPSRAYSGYVQRKGVSWYWIVVSLPSTDILQGQALTKKQAWAMAHQQVIRKSWFR